MLTLPLTTPIAVRTGVHVYDVYFAGAGLDCSRQKRVSSWSFID
jgi:hypothetical protein